MEDGGKMESFERNGQYSDGKSTGSHSSSSLIFLGTGSAGCTPSFMCLLNPSDPPCKVCFQSMSSPPEHNPDYRCNTSLLIDYCPDGSSHKYIVIDVGKTFREQVLRWFTRYKIPRVDSVRGEAVFLIILTHEHADAVHGLDDVRALQSYRNDADPMPVYLNQFTMDSVAEKFRYLVPGNLKEGAVMRLVSQIEWKVIVSCTEKPFAASGLQFVPLPVKHGDDYDSLGFLFGTKSRVAYISDVSYIPEETEYVMSKDGAGQLDLLIIEASTLHMIRTRAAHFYLSQSLDAVKRIKPKQALFIGMTHSIDHHTVNETLQEWSTKEGIPVQLAHDGLRIFIDI